MLSLPAYVFYHVPTCELHRFHLRYVHSTSTIYFLCMGLRGGEDLVLTQCAVGLKYIEELNTSISSSDF